MRRVQYFLVFLFLLSIAFRWYRLDQYLFFGFEQGRDAQIIQDIITKHDFKLVGPKTDLAGIYHGAYYYYLLIVPSIIGHGNPLALSLALILISSFTPIVMFWLAEDVTKSKKWAAVAGVLTALSYEYIVYSRWLSNVTPSIPLIVLSFLFLWRYHQRREGRWFVLAAASVCLASQFEIVLLIEFGWVFLALLLTKVIVLPKWRTLFVSVIVGGMIFLPHAIFNLRNQNVIVISVVEFATQPEHTSPLAFVSNVHDLTKHTYVRFRQTLSLPQFPIATVAMVVMIAIGLLATPWQKDRSKLILSLVWSVMSLPVIFFSGVTNLDQLYLGCGLGMILLTVLAAKQLWESLVGQKLVLVMGVIIVVGWGFAFHRLSTNQDVFFTTIQDSLNYADQRALLAYVHEDAKGAVVRFVAYTIPFLHPEGWKYLDATFYPQQSDDGAKTVYIAIEPQVPDFWRTQWLKELGPSEFIDRKVFGKLILEKYRLL